MVTWWLGPPRIQVDPAHHTDDQGSSPWPLVAGANLARAKIDALRKTSEVDDKRRCMCDGRVQNDTDGLVPVLTLALVVVVVVLLASLDHRSHGKTGRPHGPPTVQLVTGVWVAWLAWRHGRRSSVKAVVRKIAVGRRRLPQVGGGGLRERPAFLRSCRHRR